MVKIGRSVQPVKRRNQFKTGNPNNLKILLVLKSPRGVSDSSVEDYLHEKFGKFRLDETEWFYLEDPIKKFIAEQVSNSVYSPQKQLSWGRIFILTLIGSGLLCAASVAILTYINTF